MPDAPDNPLDLKVTRVTRTIFIKSDGGPVQAGPTNPASRNCPPPCTLGRRLMAELDKVAEQRDRYFAEEIRRVIREVNEELGDTGETITGVIQETTFDVEVSVPELPVG